MNENNLEISLTVATYGRYKEVEELMESLYVQDCDKSIFEVIIVDQNDQIDLSPIVDRYKSQLNITHYKTAVKGLAKAKNKGIELSSAPIITFPDDDCTYYPDTISKALTFLNAHPEADIIYGRLFNRDNHKNIMRNWPGKMMKVTFLNFHYTYSAVTAFIRKNTITFDPGFGVGSKYGIGEELDYLLQTFKLNLNSLYTPTIDIWHPELNTGVMTEQKVYYYAQGYGAICKKHLSFPMFMTFLMSEIYQLLQMFKSAIFLNKSQSYKRWLAFKGRLNGFNNFRP